MLERLCSARIELVAIFNPERGEIAIIDQFEPIKPFKYSFDQFRCCVLAPQVLTYFCSAARAEGKEIEGLIYGLLKRFFMTQLLKLGRCDVLVDSELHFENQQGVYAKQKATV